MSTEKIVPDENLEAKVAVEGEDAEFMGDAPGADIQSCVPTLKIDKKEVSAFVPPAPGKK